MNAPNNTSHIQKESMMLRPAELERAVHIKSAVEQDNRIHHHTITDYEYVQWALTTQDLPMEIICERVWLLQCFREEYHLQDTLQECADVFCQFALQQQPGYVMAFDYLQETKNYVVVNDVARHNPRAVVTHDDYRIYLGAYFYQWQAACPNFTAIRAGLTIMNECMDASFDNFDQHVTSKGMHEFMMHYPKVDKEYYFLNSPTVVNFCYGMIKPFLPEATRKAWKLGHSIKGLEGQRLDTLYLVPNPTEATARMLTSVCEAYKERLENMANFSFANCQIRRR